MNVMSRTAATQLRAAHERDVPSALSVRTDSTAVLLLCIALLLMLEKRNMLLAVALIYIAI